MFRTPEKQDNGDVCCPKENIKKKKQPPTDKQILNRLNFVFVVALITLHALISGNKWQPALPRFCSAVSRFAFTFCRLLPCKPAPHPPTHPDIPLRTPHPINCARALINLCIQLRRPEVLPPAPPPHGRTGPRFSPHPAWGVRYS